jgi:hypothetical protein
MITMYIKKKLSDSIEIKVDLYDDEIFTACPTCGKETEVTTEMLRDILNDGGDMASTAIYCKGCTTPCIIEHCNNHATLPLEDGKYICDTCAQIQGELAP